MDAKGTRPLKNKVEAIEKFPKPTNTRQLRRFLGMVNFYRRFIPNAAKIQCPLNDILRDTNERSTKPITWTIQAEQAFEEMKNEVDASDYAVGAALQQRVQNDWQPLGFFTKVLSTTQRKYSAYDRELLAVYEAVKSSVIYWKVLLS